MLTTIFLAAALAAQADGGHIVPMTAAQSRALNAQLNARYYKPHDGPKTDAELRALNAQINARVAKQAAQRMRDKTWAEAHKPAAALKPAPEAKPEPAKAEKPYTPYYESGADRKANLRRQVAAQERAQAEAARQYQLESQKQYERMLPYMLENQRQQLQRQSEIERNAIAQENAETYRRSMMNLQWQLMQQRPR